MRIDKYCYVFIPSYHRPTKVHTAKYFKKIGWDMSKIVVFVDSKTDDIEDYRDEAEKVGFKIHVFDMDEARRRYDYVHRASVSRRSAGQARNMFQDYARERGIDFYLVMDDDTRGLLSFSHRRMIRDYSLIPRVFMAIEEMMRRRKIGVFGLSQSGDFLGGYKKPLYLRKVMNTTFYLLPYIYRGERGVQDDDTSMFAGIHNEGLFTGTLAHGVVLQQKLSATQSGGLTDLYNECRLLNKALVCVIQYPSAVIAEYQPKNGGRLHHKINYKYLAPRIIKGDPRADNIAWDKFPEDYPFTLENKLHEHKGE